MKTIIVYYSLEENTHYVAQKIAENIGADLLRLHPKKAYPRGGFKKFFWGGKSAVMAQKPALEPYAFKADEYERMIIGFPVWASNVAPPLRTFVSENDLSGKHVSAFACQSGSGAEKAFAKLTAAAGVEKLENELILIDPKSKPSAENERKIKEFCDTLNKTEET